MSTELAIVAVLVVGGLVPLVLHQRSIVGTLTVVLAVAGAVAGAYWWQQRLLTREQRQTAWMKKTPREGRPRYVGSSACRACHPGEFSTWHDSFHRTMTQYPSPENVRGDFSDVTLQFDGDTYRLSRDEKGCWVDMVDPDWKYSQLLQRENRPNQPAAASQPPPQVRLPITLMTGSHHMQTYWVPGAFGNLQFNLPFTYLFESQRWAPRHDVFLLNPDKQYSMQLWNTVCLSCHATAGQPGRDPQTKTVESQTAQIGISCEACHGPAEAHVRANSSPKRRYDLHTRPSERRIDTTIFNPGRADHVKASESCGQCHAIRRKLDQENWMVHGSDFTPGGDLERAAPLVRYENPDAPGTPPRKRSVMEGSFWSDGQVRVSGRDFNGLAESPCYQRGKLSCLSCHSMHAYESTSHQLAPRMESNTACLQCHASIGTRLEAHTHHGSTSAGSLCYNCHMPHTSYGLLKAIRSHTITSPSARETLATGRPNACNLCHLDRPLAWTAARLNEWYHQPVPALSDEQTNVASAALLLLEGDAGQRALIAWHAGWDEAKRVSGDEWLVPYLAESLVDSYSVVRYIAQRSLRRLPGYADLDYDFISPPARREEARQRVLESWRRRPSLTAARAATSPGPATLLLPDGRLDESRFNSLRRLRNDHPMELHE